MADKHEPPAMKPLGWIGSSKDDLNAFPAPARRVAGYAIYLAQIGMKAAKAKPLKGFGGAGVLEVVADHDGNAYRAVYTVKFAKAVFVLHAFQKKSKRGIATAKADIELIKRRLNIAADEYQQLYGSEET
ncbi:MAG TPA: type II toxin-antitoxin system RelE/ParE family toxin [Pirellulales bacterium]|jgi:phage-related protein